MEVPDLLAPCEADADDPWVIAFLLGTIAGRYPIPQLAALQTETFTGRLPSVDRFIPILVNQFVVPGVGTTASRLFAAIILERMARAPIVADIIAVQDLAGVVTCLTSHLPHSHADQRPEGQFAIIISSLLLSLWRRIAAAERPNSVLFSQVLVPLFEVVGARPQPGSVSNLAIIQAMFLELLTHIASFAEMVTPLKSEQMLELLKGFAGCDSELGRHAKQALQILCK
jgi:hypothetical protein